VACAVGHFLLILAVCSRDILWLVARGYTSLPHVANTYAAKGELMLSRAMGESLLAANPARQTIDLYLNATGIETGYGFFGPNVPDNYKLVFELHYPDGRIAYELPEVAKKAAGLRLCTLIDNIGETEYEPLREILVRMLANAMWREHPEVTRIRAVLGLIVLPSLPDWKGGAKESYQAVRAYDFIFPMPPGHS
jgi:hypothetical protein